jgi:Xaa-Pro aminopeptidase
LSAERAERLAERAGSEGLDTLLVGDLVRPGDSSPDAMANVRWLTGFGGTSGFVIVGPDRDPQFLTDFRYTERAEREVFDGIEVITIVGQMLEELASRLNGRTGFDDSATSVRSFEKLGGALTEGTELVPAPGLVSELRRVKDEAEIAAIAEASKLADEVFEWLAAEGLAGRTEREVASAAHARMRDHGAEPSFPAIVAAGPNGALPHAEPSDRTIGPNELVVVDMGAKLGGYCSDGTRTFATGDPGEEAREVYELVLQAQRAGLAAVRAGVSGADADAASRAIIEGGGYGEYFGHGLGHGVGLEVHEAPRMGKRSEDVLVAGDVVSVEPGIYLPGTFGVRIEDLVVVTDADVRNLSTTPTALRIVG